MWDDLVSWVLVAGWPVVWSALVVVLGLGAYLAAKRYVCSRAATPAAARSRSRMFGAGILLIVLLTLNRILMEIA